MKQVKVTAMAGIALQTVLKKQLRYYQDRLNDYYAAYKNDPEKAEAEFIKWAEKSFKQSLCRIVDNSLMYLD